MAPTVGPTGGLELHTWEAVLRFYKIAHAWYDGYLLLPPPIWPNRGASEYALERCAPGQAIRCPLRPIADYRQPHLESRITKRVPLASGISDEFHYFHACELYKLPLIRVWGLLPSPESAGHGMPRLFLCKSARRATDRCGSAIKIAPYRCLTPTTK